MVCNRKEGRVLNRLGIITYLGLKFGKSLKKGATPGGKLQV